jgi:hypothetical protein
MFLRAYNSKNLGRRNWIGGAVFEREGGTFDLSLTPPVRKTLRRHPNMSSGGQISLGSGGQFGSMDGLIYPSHGWRQKQEHQKARERASGGVVD